MRQIIPGSDHVLIVERDGAVAIAAWRDPDEFLAALSGLFAVGRTEIRPGRAARSVANQLRLDMRFHPNDAWGTVEFDRAVRALDGFDLETGHRRISAGLATKDRVRVIEHGTGTVVGFTECRRVMVKLDEPLGAVQLVHAVPSMVHRLVRAL